jgi:hypothetical protein
MITKFKSSIPNFQGLGYKGLEFRGLEPGGLKPIGFEFESLVSNPLSQIQDVVLEAQSPRLPGL